MIICPDCGHANIQGVDQCERCQQPLAATSKSRYASRIDRHIAKDRIAALEPREALSVPADMPVGRVLQTMVEHRVGCVLVVEADKLAGIFTERDALMQLGAGAASMADRPVSDFMTPEPLALNLGDKVAFAFQRMDVGGYRHLPILDEGAIAGVVSVRHILRYISRRLISENS